MVRTLTVVPSVIPEWTHACLRTIKAPGEVMVVDNTAENRGVAASWNLGVQRVLKEGHDYLVLLSAAVRFGHPGGRDFFGALAAGPQWGLEGGDLGWHLVAFSRELFELVGQFDENFFPGYWEDTDFSYRVQLATDTRGGGAWVKTPVRAALQGKAHAVRYAGVAVDMPAMEAYFTRKWGGPSACEAYEHPFDRQDRSVSWWPSEGDEELESVFLEPGDQLWCPECRGVLVEGLPDAHGALSLKDTVRCCIGDVEVRHMLKVVRPCG